MAIKRKRPDPSFPTSDVDRPATKAVQQNYAIGNIRGTGQAGTLGGEIAVDLPESTGGTVHFGGKKPGQAGRPSTFGDIAESLEMERQALRRKFDREELQRLREESGYPLSDTEEGKIFLDRMSKTKR